MEVLRVFRLTRLLVRIDRLRSLFATMALSRAQAKNIAIIMFLVMFIWGVVGMKLFGIVSSEHDFFEQHLVLNGASDLMIEAFGSDRGMHARSAIGTSVLPLNIAVEVEAVIRVSAP